MAWRDEIGDYVEWIPGKFMEITFLHDEPRVIERKFGKETKSGYEWDVKVNGSKKLLQSSAFGLLKQLREVKDLEGKVLRIKREGEGPDTSYTIEAQKKL